MRSGNNDGDAWLAAFEPGWPTQRARNGVASIEKRLNRAVEKEKITAAARDAALARIEPVGTLDAMAPAQLIVEAVNESEDLKAKIFGQLDDICPPETILASNTSSISITRIAAHTERPESVIGMHFMNPVPVMKLVEIICGHRRRATHTLPDRRRTLAEKHGQDHREVARRSCPASS